MDDSDLPYFRASSRLAIHLAGEEDVQRLRKCPLLSADDTVGRLLNNLQILAPVKHWPESAWPYADLYTKSRVLSDYYVHDTDLNAALLSLIGTNLVISKPLYNAPRPLLDGDLLKVMVPAGTSTDGVTVRNQSFGQIAFLASEVVNRCGRNKELATLLLDFVLNVAVKEDPTWGETPSVNGNRSGESLQLALHRSAWPFELKVRSWVPVPLEDAETFAPAPANEANLRGLLDSNLLHNNPRAIEMLHRVFGFWRLTLTLENLDPDVEDNVVQLLQEDPDLVKAAVANLDVVKAVVENPEAAKILSEAAPDEIQRIREEIAEQRKQAQRRERNRNFGFAAQEAIAEAIELYGLNLELVDRGYDYEVTALDDAIFSFEVGSYFLEVKATTTRDVRLTPMQAKTACKYPNRFVLCVVDLYGEQIKEVWQPADVLPRAKIITDIGGEFSEIYEGITEFADADNPVRLRNEQMLRYGVSADLWGKGISINAWVESLKS